MSINPSRVTELLSSCLFKDNEIVDGKTIVPYKEVNGVQLHLGLHPERLEATREEVSGMLKQLPVTLDSVEGISFLEICTDKDGNLWTGMHKTCDELVTLGVGLDLLEFTMAKELWVICPGGLPMVRTKKPSDPNYKDTFKYRNGRERSKVVQTWLSEYKEPFMKGLLGENTPTDEIMTTLRWGMNLRDDADIAPAVAEYTVMWLNSPAGREFVSKAFDVEVFEVKLNATLSEEGKKNFREILGRDPETATVPKIAKVWSEEYRDTTIKSIVLRTHTNRDGISDELWQKLNYGSPETAEIVADTMIGWINSIVGRTFIGQAFEVDIPTFAPDRSE